MFKVGIANADVCWSGGIFDLSLVFWGCTWKKSSEVYRHLFVFLPLEDGLKVRKYQMIFSLPSIPQKKQLFFFSTSAEASK